MTQCRDLLERGMVAQWLPLQTCPRIRRGIGTFSARLAQPMASSIAEYFDGNVKSLANVRHGAKFSVGIIAPGEYRFGTEAAERMNVTCGEILVKQDGAEAFTCYPQGTCWEVAPKSGFTVKVALPAAYYCQYL